MGMCSNTSAMDGTRPGARPGPEVSFAPFPLLPPASSPPPLHHSITPFPTRFLATFPAVSLCMGWRQVASPRRR